MEDHFNLKMNLTKALQNIEIILSPPPFEQFLKDIRFFLQKAFLSLTDARELKFLCVLSPHKIHNFDQFAT